MHTTDLKVRFNELDTYGHVNHAIYLTYFEMARIEALASIGCGLDRLQADGFHLIVVDVHIRYVKPATLGHVLTVETKVTQLGTASARWRQVITRSGDLIASLELRGAFTNRDGRPHRIPIEYVEALDPLLASG
ncbi:MAG TPA: thioesterase family protein [Egibacteraceae bacterium]|nr:thioesterase family protein [Egibacteraceae bacterium]